MGDELLPVIVFEFCGRALEVGGNVSAAEEIDGHSGCVHEIRAFVSPGLEVGFCFYAEPLSLTASFEFKSSCGEFDAGVIIEAAHHVCFDEFSEREKEFGDFAVIFLIGWFAVGVGDGES